MSEKPQGLQIYTPTRLEWLAVRYAKSYGWESWLKTEVDIEELNQ